MDVPIEIDYPTDYFGGFDEEPDDYFPCCICSCLIGDEVELGEPDYFGDGRPICANCLGGEE